MGKPYGLGSVAISTTVIFENRTERYQKLLSEGGWYSVFENNEQKATDARSSFARWLFRDQQATFDQVDQLSRIQELLIMLSWSEHPLVKTTRYMELDEFAGKKVNHGRRRAFQKGASASISPYSIW